MKNSSNIFNFNDAKLNTIKYKKQSILDDLPNLNKKKQIKIRTKKLSNNIFSLYLDIWYNNKRQYQFLKLYIIGKSDTIQKDKEVLKLALEIRDKKELELFQDEHNFDLSSWRRKGNFVEYFKSLIDKKPKSKNAWLNTYKHLNKFTKGNIIFNAVDKKLCESFKEYLLKNVSQNTAHTYFSKLKAALNSAIKDDIIKQTPAQFIQIKKKEVNREFLTVDELKKLKNTPCISEQTKRAFLFSCFTGLRHSDLEKLTFNDFDEEGYLKFRQKKTETIERMKLSYNALEIINEQKKENRKSNNVFDLLYHTTTLVHIKNWVKKAGINKHISWHCGRHTFATLAITYGNDLYTVSKLLGHKEIRTTQIYARLIDKKKDEAIDRLPKI